jgi:hypothetical protein
LTLTLTGTNFTPDCSVFWNGSLRPATFVSPTQLQLPLSDADLVQARDVKLFVVNPAATGGTSDLITYPVQAIAGLGAARVSPNPWRSDRHAGFPVTFDQLTLGSQVKLFTLSGHWVRTLPALDGYANWDLKNDSGDAVASGLYLYVITNNQGQKTAGKFAIIR